MRTSPRFLASDLPPAERRVYVAVTVWYVVISLAMVWPVYVGFSRIRPLLLGMPFGLFYLSVIMVLSFAVGLTLYLWEDRRGRFAAEDLRGEGAREDLWQGKA